jgi:Tfp pilus assembly protein PilF
MGLLRADIAFERGDEAAAERGFRAAVKGHRSWDDLARLAHYLGATGRIAEAHALYAEARQLVTVREMRAYAWLEAQRGMLDLEDGRAAQALERFRRADSEYTGHPLIRAQLAQALARTGDVSGAIATYRAVVNQTGDPEHMDGLAALLVLTDPAEAAELRVRARHEHERRIARFREAGIGHFLEHLLVDPRDTALAVELAEENQRLRPGRAARELLERARLRNAGGSL